MKQTKTKREKKTELKIPCVMFKSTLYSDKETGEFLGVEHKWQDKEGKWHLI